MIDDILIKLAEHKGNYVRLHTFSNNLKKNQERVKYGIDNGFIIKKICDKTNKNVYAISGKGLCHIGVNL